MKRIVVVRNVQHIAICSNTCKACRIASRRDAATPSGISYEFRATAQCTFLYDRFGVPEQKRRFFPVNHCSTINPPPPPPPPSDSKLRSPTNRHTESLGSLSERRRLAGGQAGGRAVASSHRQSPICWKAVESCSITHWLFLWPFSLTSLLLSIEFPAAPPDSNRQATLFFGAILPVH